ncbi:MULTISPECIES: hypothetical protein [unclassified Pseudomonas]|uniref:hypothetical protein n=1 Tax=unclassified Pseudomonas TaxID=196821 RepID=UPI00244B694F|nr:MULTISPECIES: hypothetical protein [unclassified Pseudomonas]MDH0897216.1 hypothetical protein [Pseudomonas sp. GD03875]MDH1067136.1 hypothetical protein [Pseudomonas sp. GD03985]
MPPEIGLSQSRSTIPPRVLTAWPLVEEVIQAFIKRCTGSMTLQISLKLSVVVLPTAFISVLHKSSFAISSGFPPSALLNDQIKLRLHALSCISTCRPFEELSGSRMISDKGIFKVAVNATLVASA